MTSYNKLKIAILTIIASQNIHALHVEPVIIQSGTGDLLYAELNFNQANFNDQVKVSIATPEDLLTIGVKHQPSSYLNLYTRQGPNGTGVITITSSRPIVDSELNVVVKIQEGNNTYLKHIKQPITSKNNNNLIAQSNKPTNSNEKSLTPVMVVNEQDIALNLPVSSTYQASQLKSMPNAPITVEAPLVLNKVKPPELNSTIVVKATPTLTVPDLNQTQVSQAPTKVEEQPNKIVETVKPQLTQANIPAPVQAIQQPMTIAKNAVKVSADPLAKAYKESVKVNQKSAKVSPTQTVTQSENAQHIVKNNESLWVIASRIATQENRSVNDVMHQIKANNQHAFIQGDINRLKRGATLNLQASAYSKDDKKVNQIVQKTTAQKKQSKAKYRLNQAEMSLVAENSGHSASADNVNKNRTSNDLSSKVMTSRQKTVKLQKNVTQLDVALNQKDHRIHFLNARLAQLQQQLKNQQIVDKSNN